MASRGKKRNRRRPPLVRARVAASSYFRFQRISPVALLDTRAGTFLPHRGLVAPADASGSSRLSGSVMVYEVTLRIDRLFALGGSDAFVSSIG